MTRIFVLILFSLAGFMSALAQCPMCKASVESSQSVGAKSVGMGLNAGILMLLVSVYIIIFGVGIFWFRKFRRNQSADHVI